METRLRTRGLSFVLAAALDLCFFLTFAGLTQPVLVLSSSIVSNTSAPKNIALFGSYGTSASTVQLVNDQVDSIQKRSSIAALVFFSVAVVFEMLASAFYAVDGFGSLPTYPMGVICHVTSLLALTGVWIPITIIRHQQFFLDNLYSYGRGFSLFLAAWSIVLLFLCVAFLQVSWDKLSRHYGIVRSEDRGPPRRRGPARRPSVNPMEVSSRRVTAISLNLSEGPIRRDSAVVSGEDSKITEL